MGVHKLLKNIEDGKSGKNIGISMGLPDVDKVLYGIQRKYIYTIGADTSGFKIEAPVIYDSKPFELLGTREDIITKTNEEILNVNV